MHTDLHLCTGTIINVFSFNQADGKKKYNKIQKNLTETRLARLDLNSSPDHIAHVESILGKAWDMGLVEDQGYLLVCFCVREEMLWSGSLCADA